jgi:hypothetical protein
MLRELSGLMVAKPPETTKKASCQNTGTDGFFFFLHTKELLGNFSRFNDFNNARV